MCDVGPERHFPPFGGRHHPPYARPPPLSLSLSLALSLSLSSAHHYGVTPLAPFHLPPPYAGSTTVRHLHPAQSRPTSSKAGYDARDDSTAPTQQRRLPTVPTSAASV